MSTSELYLNQNEIDELVSDLPNDTSIIYGDDGEEFGICPFISFYIFNDENEIDLLVNKIILIIDDFTKFIKDKPLKLFYKSSTSIWSNRVKSLEEISKEVKKTLDNELFCFYGATSADSNLQSARWAYSTMLSQASSYSYLKFTFSDKFYRNNKDLWNTFVIQALEILQPIQSYSGYEIGNTSQLSIISPEYETVERSFSDYFYGLDIDHPASMAFHSHYEAEEFKDLTTLGAGLRTPTWCFLLSPYWLEQLGLTEQQIHSRLNDLRIEIIKLQNPSNNDKFSLWIRLGELSLYPVDKGVPELLMIANKLIKPIRCNHLKLNTLDAWDDDPNPRFDIENSPQWIARFDEESNWPQGNRIIDCAKRELSIQSLNVKAGEKCPQQGYWFTVAEENSRQYFKQGDIFPDVKSDWGDVYWQFDSEE